MKTILLFILTIAPLFVSAQNLVHTAFDTNGTPGKFLFPTDNDGNIVFSEKVDVESATTDQIQTALKSYINSYAVKYGMDKRDQSVDGGLLIYKMRYPVGKELFTMGVMGSPFFAIARDASKVDFLLEIQIKKGAFKYKLSDFITSRRMIRGEGKNNGPSNLIHWQRVNSLTKERDAYVSNNKPDKREAKEKVYDYNAQIQYEHNQYQKEYSAICDFINGLKNIKVSEDFDDFPISAEPKNESPKQIKPLDLSTYKGNLLCKGNNVYISSATTNGYDLAGAYELYKQITIDSYYNIIDAPEEAHFIMEYKVNLEGRDHAELIIKDNFGHSVVIGNASTNESSNTNHEVARNLYIKDFLPLIKQLERGKTPKSLQAFQYLR